MVGTRLNWFRVREAVELGLALADEFAQLPEIASQAPRREPGRVHDDKALIQVLQRGATRLMTLRLNLYKRARLATSFKWRLLERGVQQETADALTRRLVRLTLLQGAPAPAQDTPDPARPSLDSVKLGNLLSQGAERLARHDYAHAIRCYRKAIALDPRGGPSYRALGIALIDAGRVEEAEGAFRQALDCDSRDIEAAFRLGSLLRGRGQFRASEQILRAALRLQPKDVPCRIGLGLSLAALGNTGEAAASFRKALKQDPTNAEALVGLGIVARADGRFEQAATLFNQALRNRPHLPSAHAALAGLRKMTSNDHPWLEHAEVIASSGLPAWEEAELRFAIGKYCDDVGDFEQGFHNYTRANKIFRAMAPIYRRSARARLVDDLIHGHTPTAVARAAASGSDSPRPVLVVGMPRSGTSLLEQIIASHPAAIAAGELEFWNDAARRYEPLLRQGPLEESLRSALAREYLQTLNSISAKALRVVDKMPLNADHLGLIHTTFPRARVIYMQRDPIDTCLSCYFQPFSLALNFTTELSDLAHYYGEHQRLMGHWRATLPGATLLEVPYEALVTEPAVWVRRILEFIGLEWHPQCLDFHQTERPIITASFWQVRQRIYQDSVGRWRNYEKFLGELRSLKAGW
jgi:tetratricopeptide (TPR) repeat protein